MQSNHQRCDETRKRWRMLGAWMALSLVGLLAPNAITAAPTATTFSYEGRLSVGGQPPTGLYDFRFVVFDAETNGNAVSSGLVVAGAGVTNGSVRLDLDFGYAPFAGSPRWLEIEVKDPAREAVYTRLTPRQRLAPVPYALSALSADHVSWTNVTGTPIEVQQLGQIIPFIFNTSSRYLTVQNFGDASQITWVRDGRPFSGWGQGIGHPPDFSAVQFYIRPWDSTHPITQVRCRIKETDFNGPVVADKMVLVSTSTGVVSLVTVDFGSLVPNQGTPLWLEFHTDGYTPQTALPSNLINDPGEKFSSSLSLNNLAMADAASTINFYVGFLRASTVFDGTSINPQFKESLGTIPTSNTVALHLPATLYAVEGRELNVYFANLIRANVPISSLDVRVVCNKGAQFSDFWRLTPTTNDVGSFPFRIEVAYDGNTIVSKTCTLVVKPLSAGTGVVRKVCMIGDSTTANSIMAGELSRLFVGDPMGLQFVGTKGEIPVQHEGIAGWSFSKFFTLDGSPFLFSGVFDFHRYLTTNGLALASGDWVTINLGINDVFSYLTDSTLTNGIDEALGLAQTMITSIQSAVPGIRVGVCVTIPPPATQDSFAVIFGTTQTQARYRRNHDLWVDSLLRTFDNRKGAGIYIVPIHVNLDTVNNFTRQVISANARNTNATLVVSPNGIHPDSSGYFQIADSFKAFFKGQE